MNIASSVATGISVCSTGSVSCDGFRRIDYFDIKAGSERFHVRDDHLLVSWRAGGREELGKLPEPESGQDGSNIGVVAEGKV